MSKQKGKDRSHPCSSVHSFIDDERESYFENSMSESLCISGIIYKNFHNFRGKYSTITTTGNENTGNRRGISRLIFSR